MARKLNGIELTRYDDLFKTDAERETDHQERVQIVPAEQVFPYARQPYSVDRPSADLVRLMDSIERTGIAEPLIVRPRSEGGYEIISGHRRDYCAKVVGLDTRPVIVRNYSDEDADILVVDYNINRENLLPSEKAFSYKMRLEAMNRQGQRTDLTSRPVVEKLGSADSLGTAQGDSGRQVQRYIRLTQLIPPLLDLVDAGKIAFRPAVELSYLTEEEQNSLLDSISSEQSTPSLAQALKMKEFSQNGRLNADVILSIMCEQKPNQKEKISFQSERLKPFIPKNFTAKQTEDYVIKALEYYHRYQLRQKERDR